MIIQALISFASGFAGALMAIALFTWYQRMKQLKKMIAVFQEVNERVSTEISFNQIARQLREEGLED